LLYVYEAWNEDGKAVTGTVDADTLDEARQALRGRNLSVNSLRAPQGFLGGVRALVTRVLLLVLSGGVAFSVMASQGMGQGLSVFIGVGVGLISVCCTLLTKP